MHPYASDSEERRNVIVGLLVAAGLVAFLIHILLGLVGDVPWWIDVPSVLGAYGLLYKAFDKALWKIPLLSTGVVHVPDLNGRWRGTVRSGVEEHAGESHDVDVSIVQTWTHMEIKLTGTNSESRSTAATFVTKGAAPCLSYQYMNEPKPHAPPAMEAHSGTTRLQLVNSNSARRLKGDYYSGRGRQGFGALELEYVGPL
jgi:SMODS-associating 2TM, beta-strand rich effector domain